MLKNLYLICGKSGSGKTYAVDKLHDKYGYNILISYTTRKPRHAYDEDHIYTNISNYYHDKENGLIAADTCFHHNFYWSRKEQIEQSDLYVIDKNGIESLKKLNTTRTMVVIYIDASEDKRINNMRLRGDSSASIYGRLENDQKEFNGIEHLADFIINGDNDAQWKTIHNIIKKCEEVNLDGID